VHKKNEMNKKLINSEQKMKA